MKENALIPLTDLSIVVYKAYSSETRVKPLRTLIRTIVQPQTLYINACRPTILTYLNVDKASESLRSHKP